MMKKTTLFSTILTGILALLINHQILAQDTANKVKFNISADIVSSYIWRGLAVDQSPNILPTFSMVKGNFTLGVMAAVNFTGTYKEFDPYVSYAIKDFSVTVTDYIWTPQIDNMPYFDYNSETTGHYFEAQFAYKRTEKFPISIMAATMVYGADKKIDKIDMTTLDTTYVNNYSTYAELGYTFKVNGYKLDPVLGITTGEGLYGTSFGLTNIGITGYRSIKINSTFELPMKASIFFNPQASKAYFVLGITL